MCKCFKRIGNTENISSWESKGLFNEVIKPPDNKLASTVKHTGKKIYVTFNGSA